MPTPNRKIAKLLLGYVIVSLSPLPARAAELRPETNAAFDHYRQLTEARMNDDLRDGHFLYFDNLPAARRAGIDKLIHQGGFSIEQLHTLEDGRPITVPGGLIHDWMG